jgi:hypothetical protein
MTKILVPRYQPVFLLAGGPGAIWHPGTFVFLSGGPFGVHKLKLVNLTSIPALLSQTTAATPASTRFFIISHVTPVRFM